MCIIRHPVNIAPVAVPLIARKRIAQRLPLRVIFTVHLCSIYEQAAAIVPLPGGAGRKTTEVSSPSAVPVEKALKPFIPLVKPCGFWPNYRADTILLSDACLVPPEAPFIDLMVSSIGNPYV